jgi:hypothetical protein
MAVVVVAAAAECPQQPSHKGPRPQQHERRTISSLIGVPVIGLPAAANTTAQFSLETSYMLLSCQPWDTFLESDTPRLGAVPTRVASGQPVLQ